MMSQSFRESMSMCKDLTQRTTDFQKAIVNSQLHNRCSRDSPEILQKVQRGESTNLILYSVLLVKIIRLSTLY